MRDEHEHLEAARLQLIDRGVIEPLELGGLDEQAWADCDLVSLAENRLQERSWDALSIDAATRVDLVDRVLTEPPWAPSRRSYEVCYWLRFGSDRAGTIALATSISGMHLVNVTSLYVLPSHRRLGIASTALRELRDALGEHGLGIRLETSWLWPAAVDFYRTLGMWVRMWKRQLTFEWSSTDLHPHTHVGANAARLWVEYDGSEVVLASAERDGERLVMDTTPSSTEDAVLANAAWQATPTLVLALARAGWPLIRSEQHYREHYWADGGPPESLAYKITIWEAEARHHGWRVPTPAIPGLSYPTWAELEARWEADRQAFEAELRRPKG